MRYEVSQEPKDVEPGDDEDPAIVLTTGKIPEYDGYELVCRIRPIPDVVQMTLNDDGEVMA